MATRRVRDDSARRVQIVRDWRKRYDAMSRPHFAATLNATQHMRQMYIQLPPWVRESRRPIDALP
jgi:hypothetical protein